MNDLHEIIKVPKSVSTRKPKEPEEVRITLSVCSCYSYEKITFIPARAEQVVRILGVSLEDLECSAISAMFTGKAQVVACYKQRDIAEAKLAQLDSETPFILRACHLFKLVTKDS